MAAKTGVLKSGINFGSYYSYFIFTALLILSDQLTKYMVASALPLGTGKAVFPGLLNLVHVRNPGGAFSVFAGSDSLWKQRIFIILTVVVVAVIIYAYGKVPRSDLWNRAAYVLISGGALGNLIDRARMGEVIDFLDIHVGQWHWPVFNVADSAITAGAIMLLISLLRGR
jgi:signal peptidase II